MSIINSYWILQNARVAVFNFFELLGKKQKGLKYSSPQPRLKIENCEKGKIISWIIGSVLVNWTLNTIKNLSK